MCSKFIYVRINFDRNFAFTITMQRFTLFIALQYQTANNCEINIVANFHMKCIPHVPVLHCVFHMPFNLLIETLYCELPSIYFEMNYKQNRSHIHRMLTKNRKSKCIFRGVFLIIVMFSNHNRLKPTPTIRTQIREILSLHVKSH